MTGRSVPDVSARGVGPDLVLPGSARSGTSSLAALLGAHPAIDPGSVKEPNYFSVQHERGPAWFDGLYGPRDPGTVRLDASMTYTYPRFPDALRLLAEEAPQARVVYAVRHPLERMVSHLALRRDHLHNAGARELGEALRSSTDYAGASDYAHWLTELVDAFGAERLLVVPFPVVTGRRREVADQVCRLVGLPPLPVDEQAADLHRNVVTTYRVPGVRQARRLVGKAGLYPAVRRVAGPDRLRRLRNRVTREAEREPVEQALASCSSEQRDLLRSLLGSAQAAVADHLVEQDRRCGLSWAAVWEEECPAGVVS